MKLKQVEVIQEKGRDSDPGGLSRAGTKITAVKAPGKFQSLLLQGNKGFAAGVRWCALDLSPVPGIGRNMRGFPMQRARANLCWNEAGSRKATLGLCKHSTV